MNENCRTVSQRMVSDTLCLNADKTHLMLGETGQKLLASIKRLTAMRRSGLDRLAMLSFIKTFYHTLSQLRYMSNKYYLYHLVVQLSICYHSHFITIENG